MLEISREMHIKCLLFFSNCNQNLNVFGNFCKFLHIKFHENRLDSSHLLHAYSQTNRHMDEALIIGTLYGVP
jgi:hypothetical protein